MGADIFVSYARRDIEKVRYVIGNIKKNGYDVWWDQDIPIQDGWRQEIENQAKEARCVVVFWSVNSREAPFVLAEAGIGAERSRLISVMLDGKAPPLPHKEDQAIKMPRWRRSPKHQGFKDLINSVSAYAGLPIKNCIRTETGAVVFSPSTIEERRHFQDCEDLPYIPKMVVIPPGCSMIGSPAGETGRGREELTQTNMKFNKPFALGKYPVTFMEYETYCNELGLVVPDDAGWGKEERPVINVSWNEAQKYCEWLTEKTGASYRLPTEIEWEYACRAGVKTAFACGDTITTKDANFNGHHQQFEDGVEVNKKGTVPAGSYLANAFWLYDMHGNVWEWCADICQDGTLASTDEVDSLAGRVLKGGSWRNSSHFLRCSKREELAPITTGNAIGFRVARDIQIVGEPSIERIMTWRWVSEIFS